MEPSLSVVIVVPPEAQEIPSLSSLQRLEGVSQMIEIIVARGRMPSVQRNLAVARATGDWIWFLDNDSLVSLSTWQAVGAWIQREDVDVDVIGGPNLCPSDAPWLQRAFSLVMSSRLAFGPSRARYLRVGAERLSSEKELILCHLLMRRTLFLEHEGFDEGLYPNEENALLEKISSHGGRLWYDPECSVERYPRRHLSGFMKMIFRYGRGRAQQFKHHPGKGSLLNMLPGLFSLYFWLSLFLTLWGNLHANHLWMLWIPAAGVAVASLLEGLLHVRQHPLLPALISGPLIPLCHLAYGHGFLLGMLGHRDAPEARNRCKHVDLEVITSTHKKP